MKEKVKQQHYVSQFYLRFFATPERKEHYIQVFDKKENRSFKTNIRNVGAEQFFYESYIDGQKTENDLSNLEGEYNAICIKLLESQDLSKLSVTEKNILASFIVMQEIRTREMRNIIGDLRRELKDKLLKRGVTPDFEKEVIIIDDKEAIKEQQLGMMRDITDFVEILEGMKWVIILNNTDWGFWTSDHPVVRFNQIPAEFPFGNMGLKSKGIELHLPLSPKMMILILDPVVYGHLNPKIVCTNTEQVKYENHLQIKYATRFVFSKDDDFTFAETVLRTDQEVNVLNRIKIMGLDNKEE